MSTSAKLTAEQLKDIIADDRMMDQGAT
jgi:hypothetical protein